MALTTITSTYLLDGLKRADNRTVWQQFVARYRPLIVKYARNTFGLTAHDAEDAAQVILAAFSEAHRQGKYDIKKGRFKKWLFGIAKNQLLNRARKEGRKHEVQPFDALGTTGFMDRIPDDVDLEQRWETEWQQAVYQQCMAEVRQQLDAKTVQAFELFAGKGLPAAEVGAQLGMTPNAVFLAKHHVLKRIRELVPQMTEVY